MAKILICFIILNGCLYVIHSNIKSRSLNQTTSQITHLGVDVDERTAIRIAREHAERIYGSIGAYSIVVCQEELLWRVLFEPKDATTNRFGIQYILSKRSGRVLTQRKFPLSAPNNQKQSTTPTINRTQAIAIAKKDGMKAYRSSLKHYRLTECELSYVWIIVFSPPVGSIGGGPEYVIDKETGVILDKKYYQ